MKWQYFLLVVFELIIWPCAPAIAGHILIWGYEYDANSPNNVPLACSPDGNDFVAIGASWHTVYNTTWFDNIAVKANGSLATWQRCSEVTDPAINSIVKVSCGWEHTLGLLQDGTLSAWGNNYHGQCDVPDGNDFIEIAAGIASSMAIRSDGTLVFWGYLPDLNEPLIDPNDPNAPPPYVVRQQPTGNDFIAIAMSQGETCYFALRSDGTLEAWGRDIKGLLDVPDGNYKAVAAGGRHVVALRTDGSLVAWGNNDSGRCNVPTGNNHKAIACGWSHSLAIRTDGTLVAWGGNSQGQCIVPDGNDFVAIAGCYYQSIALTSGETKVLTVQTAPSGIDCVQPGVGEYECYVGQKVFINAPRCPFCPYVYKFVRWEGDVDEPNSMFAFLTMDRDRSITAVYAPDERRCGDECHPILQGDLNKDCYINFDDFAIYCQQWMSCTHPDCD